ncbi:MAG TPA: hypothetical protein VLH87_03635 [Pyrinomonadaceae bacterium]|nr:hypothetical protein [Pyrinomonadaceae bacterium]
MVFAIVVFTFGPVLAPVPVAAAQATAFVFSPLKPIIAYPLALVIMPVSAGECRADARKYCQAE